MAINLESVLRSTISHGALSAGIALSLTTIADDASAQQPPRPQGQGGVVLDPVDVEAQTPQADGEGAYAVQSASSPKQTAPLINTPQTVTVVPQAIIQERGARDLIEVLRNTPGITFDAGENGFGTSMTNFKLRGFDTSGSVFIDGSRDNGTYPRDTFNTERVEIFKGPAADNGRGSAGGYINMVTKSPILQNFIAGEIGFGFDEYNSEARKRTTFDGNYMLSPTTAIRLNGMWEDGGVAGREIAENNAWGFAPSIAFGLGTNARTIISYEHLTRRDLPDWGVPAATMKGMSGSSPYNPALGNVPRDNFFGLRSDFDDVDADTALVRFEYDFSNTSRISNQTRWSQVSRTARFTVPTGVNATNPPTQATTSTYFYDRTNTTLTNLTNYSAEFYTGAYKHNLAAGVELSREESDARRFGTAAPGNTDLYNPNPDRAGGAPFVSTTSSGVKIDTIGAYLYDTIELNRHWQITGGLRVEHYKARLDGVADFETSKTTLGGKLGIVYKPVEDVSYYAAVGLSHLPPGSYLSNSDISRTGDDSAFPNLYPDADPVRSVNYEIGVKRDFFGGRLSTTAALFRTDKRVSISGCTPVTSGDITSGCVPGSLGLRGYGHQIAQGLELGAAGNLTDNWKVFGGLLWMKTEKKYSREQELARMTAALAMDYPVGWRNGFSGDELSFSPEFSGNLWTTYRIPQTPWTIGGGVQYVGSSWLGRPDDAERIVPNGRFGRLPGYFLAHLMASYEIRKDVEVRFNVDNVFDEKYAVSTNWAGTRVMLGAPRTYRVSASFKY